MTYLLWIAAFVGVAVIYFGERIVNFIGKTQISANNSMLIRGIGVVIAAAAMVILYKTGNLI